MLARYGFFAWCGAAAASLAGCVSAPITVPPAATPVEAAPQVAVAVDPRVELFVTIFRLAGAQEFQGGNPLYAKAADAHFKPFADHPAVAMARALRQNQGISYNAVPELALYFGPLPSLDEQVPIERQASMDPRWTPERARAFAAAARDFARLSQAAAFFESQRPLFAVLERRARTLTANEADLAWIRNFYGDIGRDRFVVVPSMFTGQIGYGPLAYRADGGRDLYAILGSNHVDEDGLPALGLSQANTLVHEFGHSLVNPLVLEHEQELKPVAEAMLAQSKSQMEQIGYPRAIIVLYESIIRAGVARYKLAHYGPAVAERELARQRQLGFVWIDDLYELLGRYEAERDRYPTFRQFYPALQAHLQTLPPRLPAIAAAYDAKRPRIVEMIPALQSAPIDPATREIRLRFDRPLAKSFGLNSDASKLIPKITNVSFADGDRTVVINVELEPGKTYELPFFATGDYAIRSRDDDLALAPTTLRFSTAPASRPRR